MWQNFTCSWHNLRTGRPWTLLTCAFSQMDLSHFAVNMLVLHSFGGAAAQVLGARRFLGLYAAAGLASAAAHLAFVRATATTRRGVTVVSDVPSHGASGSVMATAVLYAALNPRAQILVFFVLPVNVVLGVGALVLWDLAHLGERAQAGRASVDRAAHLAGAACGLGYYLLVLRRGGPGSARSAPWRRWR